MRFDFSEEQRAIRDVARDVLAEHASPERLRAVWRGEDDGGRAWSALAEVGVLGLTVPQEHGGAGGDAVDLVLVLEEAGRAALAGPLVETVAVAAPVLATHGAGEAASRWLPAIAAGEARVGLALRDEPYVVAAVGADVVLMEDDRGLTVRPRGDLDVVPVASEDRGLALGAVTAFPGNGDRLDAGAAADARLRAVAGTAAVLNGVSRRLLEMALDHARKREQFGRPIGSFQAVKHPLATAHALVESSRAAAWYAAHAIARGADDAGRAAATAKTRAAETGAYVNRVALQVHGGIGFTWEHDLHLWLKRGKALEGIYGTARAHRARIADELFADA